MSSSKKDAKVVTSNKISKAPKLNDEGLQEVTLVKDHGEDKKGSKLLRHPNTAKMLIERGIAK